jgi:hypothetical protein
VRPISATNHGRRTLAKRRALRINDISPARVFAAIEAHRAFDALGVAYRKALRELGFAG